MTSADAGGRGPLAVEELLRAALLGLERRPLSLSASGGGLGDLLARLGERALAAPESALLDAAALVLFHERAGRLPPVEETPLPAAAPASPEDLPRVSPLAERLLGELVAGRYADLLPEWLDGAARAGQRAPETSLPALLEWGRAQADLRTALAAVLGARGRWLAAHNPAWAWAVDAEGPAGFDTAPRAARLAILRALRGAEPERARELLGTTWRESSSEERAVLLHALAVNLSPADEAFLEAALDDRAREVRRAAAELLARIGSSALSRRMIARAGPRVILRGAAHPSLEVALPDTCDEAMQRDGIQPRPPAGTGEKAWWMMQMMAMIPPSHWSRRFGRPPHEIVESAARGPWRDLLVDGWARAAERHRDETWAEVLLRTRTPESARRLLRLMDVLSPGARERLVLGELDTRAEPIRPMHEGPAALLRYCRHDWSEPFTRRVITTLRGEERRTRDAYPVISSLLASMAGHLAPSVAGDETVVGPLPDFPTSRWPYLRDIFLPVMRFRLALQSAFPAAQAKTPADPNQSIEIIK